MIDFSPMREPAENEAILFEDFEWMETLMVKVRTRKLWLKVWWKVPGVPKERVIQTLLRSIRRGDYVLPRGWRVVIGWKNNEGHELKRGEWTEEMRASAESSSGWDYAVENYLNSQRGTDK